MSRLQPWLIVLLSAELAMLPAPDAARAAESTELSADGPQLPIAVDRYALQYRIMIYNTFRRDRAEYARRSDAWEQLRASWIASGAKPDHTQTIVNWLREATRRSRDGQIASLPRMPVLGSQPPRANVRPQVIRPAERPVKEAEPPRAFAKPAPVEPRPTPIAPPPTEPPTTTQSLPQHWPIASDPPRVAQRPSGSERRTGEVTTVYKPVLNQRGQDSFSEKSPDPFDWEQLQPPRLPRSTPAPAIAIEAPTARVSRPSPPASRPSSPALAEQDLSSLLFDEAEPTSAEVNVVELTARITGYNRGLKQLENRLLMSDTRWDARQLAAAVAEYQQLQVLHRDADLYLPLLDENQRRHAGAPRSPQLAEQLLKQAITQQRIELTSGASPDVERWQVDVLDALLRQLDAS